MQAILFIHGFTAEEKDNLFFLEKIRKNPAFEVSSFFLPGHGPNPRIRLTYQTWIDTCEKELKKLLKRYSQVTLIGHSMGGVLATILASRHPEVTSLILLAPAFYFGNLQEWIYRAYEKTAESKHPLQGSLKKWKSYPNHYFWEFRRLRHQFHDVPNQVTCKTLVLHGTRDPVVPLKASNYVKEHITSSKITLIEGVGHQLFKSSKKEFVVAYIQAYLTTDFYQETI